jgi:hypothetical protein
MLLIIELSHHSVAATRFELVIEAYETSELAITLNRNFYFVGLDPDRYRDSYH